MASEDSIIRKAKWASLKEEWIDCIINNRPITWGLLATKYGFLEQTVRNKASMEGWAKEVGQRQAQHNALLEEKLTERTTGALEKLNQDFMTSEASIRGRHATIARGLQAKAMRRLQDFDMKDFKPRDALAMLEIGLREERYAMGMKEIANPQVDDINKTNAEYKPVAEQMGGHKKVQQVGLALLKMVRDLPIEEIMDAQVKGPTEYEPVPEASKPAPTGLSIKKAPAK